MRAGTAALLVLLAAAARAAEPGPFSVRTLETGGKALEAAAVPAVPGGPAALLCAVRREGPAGASRVFLQASLPGLAKAAEIPVPADAVLFDVADVLPAPGPEILVLCPDGVRALERRGAVFGGEWKPLLKARTFFDAPEPAALHRYPLALELSGDGAADLLVPQAGGYLAALGGSFEQAFALSLEGKNTMLRMAHEIFQTHFVAQNCQLPALRRADFDGDGLPDLVALAQKDLVVFLGAGAKGFPPQPTYRVRLRFLESAAEEPEEDSFEGKRLLADDVDGDGLADLVAVRTQGKVGLFSSIRTRLELFLGRRGAFYPEVPDRILTVPGVGTVPVIADLDGDGRKDLVVPALRTDVLAGVKAALVQEVTLTYAVFACAADGLWEESPSFEDDARLPVSDIEKGKAVPAAAFDGDFDGDGRKDRLAFSTGAVRIHPGLPGRGIRFADEPRWEVKADLSNDF
ncbi:MAG: VCBS repeat-containing protein, partial [Planctomycetes bacterium]|nr:VCBS repeat-containing protein [Planctomycetota bacterium]